MRESIFQSEIKRSIDALMGHSHYHKIPDVYAKGDFETKRPYDCYVFYNKEFCALELKQIRECKSFPFENVEPHQIYYLQKVKQNLGLAYVVINYRFSPSQKQMKKYKLKENKYNFTIAIDIDYFTYIRVCYKDRKSWPVCDILTHYKDNTHNFGLTFITWEKMRNINTYIWRIDKLLY